MTTALQNTITRFIVPNKILLLALLLTIVAALPRLYHLGDLSFYMDEETSAFAAKSMAEGKPPQMPSGMPYHRSLPHTWINSISAKIFGLNKEYSYRLPGALLGIFSIPLIFLLARPHVGTSVAFLAALLLATSEWHIITSRQARMYAPFLFLYIACGFAILKWANKDTLNNLVICVILFIAAASFHNLGVFLAFIPLIALFIKGYTTTSQYKLILFSIISGVSAYIYGYIFVEGPYSEWKNAYGIVSTEIKSENNILYFFRDNVALIVRGIIGSALGVWLAVISRSTDTENGKEFRILTKYVLAILFGGLAATGILHGASLSILLLLLLYSGSIKDYLKQTYKPIIAISAIALIVAIQTIIDLGFYSAIRSLFTFPYTNWITLNAISPGVTFLFASLMLYLAMSKKSSKNYGPIVLLIIALCPIVLIGILKKWAAARYLLIAYPFMLVCCAYVLQMLLETLYKQFSINKRIPTVIISSIICLSGLLGGHGLLSAYKAGTVDHGDKLNSTALIFPFYPDHKYPGEFVLEHIKVGDTVIAEDVLEQRWYAGKVDYWLRKYGSESGGGFLYKGKDNKLHDIYVNSIVATAEILDDITNDKSHRIWLITSGETYNKRDLYLRKDQRQWLEHIESTHTPVFTGKDKITQVYCLNCAPVK